MIIIYSKCLLSFLEIKKSDWIEISPNPIRSKSNITRIYYSSKYPKPLQAGQSSIK